MTTSAARARLRRAGIPIGHIGWIVDRLHVGTSDDDVRADVRRRLTGATGAPWSEQVIEAAEVIAVAHHRANQADYRWVMGGHA